MRRYVGSNIALTLVVMMLCTLPVWGQSADATKLKIRDIKLNDQYVYGEASDADKNMAYNRSLGDLLMSINEMRMAKGAEVLKVNDLIGRVQDLSYNRGEGVMLVFTYMTVKDALSLQPKGGSTTATTNTATTTAGHGSGSNTSTTTASNTATTTASHGSGNNTSTTTASNTSTTTASHGSGSNTSTANNSNTSATTASHGSSTTTTVASGGSSAGSAASNKYRSVTLNVLERDMFTNAWEYLSKAKDRGEISALEKARDRASIPSDAFVMVVGKDYSVIALLAPASGGRRQNLKTNQADDLGNYSNVAFIWYK